MEFIGTINGLVALITGLVGLIGTGVSAYFAIKNFITATKTKSVNEIWSLIQSIADSAIKEAEKTCASGADKKRMVVDAVKAGCKAAGVNIDQFIDQLSDYIDSTITFVNDMTKNK